VLPRFPLLGVDRGLLLGLLQRQGLLGCCFLHRFDGLCVSLGHGFCQSCLLSDLRVPRGLDSRAVQLLLHAGRISPQLIGLSPNAFRLLWGQNHRGCCRGGFRHRQINSRPRHDSIHTDFRGLSPQKTLQWPIAAAAAAVKA
jgi:hypothetical protein